MSVSVNFYTTWCLSQGLTFNIHPSELSESLRKKGFLPGLMTTRARHGCRPRETTHNRGRPRDGNFMKLTAVAFLSIFLLSSCTPSDQRRANEKAREAGQEIQREAQRASQELKQGVDAFDRKAGPKLDAAGREIKEETHRAAEKVKRRADQIQGNDQSQEPPPPPDRSQQPPPPPNR
jgi:hypothetical protein